MVRTIKNDLVKMFSSYHFYLCVLAWGGIYTFSCWKFQSEQLQVGSDLPNLLWSIFGGSIILYCFLACVIGGSLLYCAEERHRYLQFEIQRIGVKKYVASKLCVSYTGGFLVVLLGTVLTAILIYMMFYVGLEDKLWDMMEIQQLAWTVLGHCMLCGILSVMGYLTAVFYSNVYVAMTIPIVVYYALLALYGIFSVPDKVQFHKYFIYLDSRGGLISACIWSVCMLAVFYIIAVYRTKRRLEHA